jgi:hypothetical protein
MPLAAGPHGDALLHCGGLLVLNESTLHAVTAIIITILAVYFPPLSSIKSFPPQTL